MYIIVDMCSPSLSLSPILDNGSNVSPKRRNYTGHTLYTRQLDPIHTLVQPEHQGRLGRKDRSHIRLMNSHSIGTDGVDLMSSLRRDTTNYYLESLSNICDTNISEPWSTSQIVGSQIQDHIDACQREEC